jgi:hypothetical protein
MNSLFYYKSLVLVYSRHNKNSENITLFLIKDGDNIYVDF